ncbi:MAG: hypothetical protein AAGL99_18345, partial [Pseudomonadota bacterium]
NAQLGHGRSCDMRSQSQIDKVFNDVHANAQQRLEVCFDLAQSFVENYHGDPAYTSSLNVTREGVFEVFVESLEHGCFEVSVDLECVVQIQALLASPGISEQLLDEDNNGASVSRLTNLSLIFLFLHEFSHIEGNHFLALEDERARFYECPPSANVPSGLSSYLTGRATAEGIEIGDIYHCLELQADDLAFQLFFDSAFEEDWTQIRERAAAATLTFLVVDRAHSFESDQATESHPSPEARVFALTGFLLGLWLHDRAQTDHETGVVSVNTQEADVLARADPFLSSVLQTVISDMSLLMQASGSAALYAKFEAAPMIIEDLGIWARSSGLAEDVFSTQGAKDAARLTGINAWLVSTVDALG